MKTFVVVAVAAAGTWFAVPAHAQSSPGDDFLCQLGSVADPTVENDDLRTGILRGGPLFATRPGDLISLRCTIQVGAANWSHSGADAASASSGYGPGVAVLAPTLVAYLAPEGQPVYTCTQITVAGWTYYWDHSYGRWSSSGDVACFEPISCDCPPGGPLGPILDLIEEIVVEHVDPVACGILAAFAPGVPGVVDVTNDGDVDVLGDRLYDCPPYDW